MIHILKAILEQAHAGYWEKNFSENKTYLSPGWKSMLGYQEEELRDSISAWQSHIFPEDLGPIRNEFEDYLKTDLSQPYEADIRFLHKNGSIVWFKCTCKVVEKDSLGKPILMIGTYFDVTKSKKIEFELQHTVDRLALATQTARVGIWDLDFTSGKISWDDTMFELYGTTREKFSGTVLDWESSLHPDDLERCKSEYAQALSGEKEFDTQFRVIWPDGSIHFIKAIAIVQRMASGKPFRMLGTNWDITKHKNAEIALKESYELTKVFIENAPSAIAMFDTNMKYMAASQQWLVDYYLGGIEIIGRSHYEIFPEIGDEWKSIHQECLHGKVIRREEEAFTRLDGTIQWILWEVRPWYASPNVVGGILMYTADITTIKRKEFERSKLEEILTRTNEAAQIGSWELDLETNTRIWSKVTKSIFELPEDYKPDGREVGSFFRNEEERKRSADVLAESIQTGKPFDVEVEILTAKGNMVWTRSIGKPEYKDGKCIRVSGTFQNIQEQKLKELALQRTLDLLNNQNERLLNFAHIVSHNLRSHSGNISMLLKILQESKNESEKEKMIQYIAKASDSLMDTVWNLNEVVSIQTNKNLQNAEISLRDYIEKAAQTIGGEIQKYQVQIHNLVSDSIRVRCNVSYMESILLNFLTNAVKYRHPDRIPEITLNAKYEENRLVLSITDNGLGIDMKKYGDKLFGMYKTFHNNKDAKGIGLFITKNQVEAMGGKIEVESRLNNGTTFKIIFL
ncbi:PAS domain-containing sensor histidine kinase [Leptospira noguchii]|uniref:PAS domain-containing sensor histidine kinase n=1 Tax=Leptospira noguchii TaxID=28182 RepID=UPI001147157C|nr:PAS domain-containing sensor histidine kinase [Leptospira noguchii]TQE73910.1 PAS domain S-box protein [Leptospira noguchii]UOG35470.1 PAS domain-containing protein [Leptospira noguchii]UOG46389.1 PAS domain-containing protein [Leptospira noguchii]UOG51353.1 PAS domain-containing protein [Leptospira noguchii]